MRHRILNGPSHHMRAYLLSLEAKGWAEPLTSYNYWKTYGSTLGSLLVMDSYVSMAVGLSGGAQSSVSLSINRQFRYLKQYTHINARMLQRKISHDDIIDAIKKPLKIKSEKIDKFGRSSQVYIGKRVTVVVNPKTGKLITAYPTGSKMIKKYSR